MYDGAQPPVMEFETGKNAIDFLLKNCDEGEVSFFGGEPLIEFRLIEKLAYYAENQAQEKNKTVNFHVTTNGTLITKSVARFLNSHNFSVIVSIDGTESVHNCNRAFLNSKKGSYEAVIKGAHMLIQEYQDQSRITVRGTFAREQSLTVSQSFEHLVGLGFENISLEPAMGGKDDSYALQQKDIILLSTEYNLLAKKYNKTVLDFPRTKFFHYDKFIRDILHKRRDNRPCGAANGTMTVSTNGDLFPCHRIVKSEYKLGNVNDIALNNSETNIGVRELFARAITNNRRRCVNCWARNLCGGTCYAYSIERNKDILEPENFSCAYMKLCIENAIGIMVENQIDMGALDVKIGRMATARLFFDSGGSSECRGGQRCMFCEKSCTSGCTKSCTGGCTKSCTGGCTGGCTSGCTKGCTGGCTGACTWQDR